MFVLERQIERKFLSNCHELKGQCLCECPYVRTVFSPFFFLFSFFALEKRKVVTVCKPVHCLFVGTGLTWFVFYCFFLDIVLLPVPNTEFKDIDSLV